MNPSLLSTFSSLPELLSSQHLVELGLYPSLDAAYLARIRGHSPDFLKLHKKVLYPKRSVLEFIEHRMQKGHGLTAHPATSIHSND
jgi:hypothetical protein